jgi:hypothetical protein
MLDKLKPDMSDINEAVSHKTTYALTECDPSLAPAEYKALVRFLSRRRPKTEHERIRWHGKYLRLRKAYDAKAKVAQLECVNLCPTSGRSVLAQRLAGVTTYTGIINYLLLGSGTATPANGDTQLGTEVYRQVLSDLSYVNNVAYLSCFIVAGTATGTHTEAGLVIDGAAGANTGQLFSHVLLSPSIVKGALSSLSLDISITVS